MVIAIEPADLNSLNELWRIERECFTKEAYTKQQISSLLEFPNAVGLIARVNGDVAGFVIGVVEDSRAKVVGHIYTIDVAVKRRRRGVGARLLAEIESVFVSRGVDFCYLEVRADNQAARRLYDKQGYRETEALEDYYSAGAHALRMVKQLKLTRNALS